MLRMKEADIVYARLILMHLQSSNDALNNMYALLKPGGMLSLQEASWSTVHCSFPCEAIDNYRDAVIALGSKMGADYNLGKKLPYICQKLGFNVVYADNVETKLDIPTGKALFIVRASEFRDKMIEAGIVTAENLDSWVKIITDLPEEDDKAYIGAANIMHILVEKPNR